MLSSCDLLSCEHSESMWWTSSGIHHHRPDTALVPFKGAGCPDLTPALWPQWISLIACTWHKLGQGRLFSWMCSGGFKKEHSFLYVAKPYIVSLGNHHCQVPPPPPPPLKYRKPVYYEREVRGAQKNLAAFWSLFFILSDIQLNAFLHWFWLFNTPWI